MKMYINGLGCVAPQNTRETPLFRVLINEPVVQTSIVKPNYKDYIAPAAIRRMGKAIKMGVVASKDALKEAGCENPDAIIAGTGLGCQQDSEKFLENILKNDEKFLTPTSFIQSTHNTVAGQVALMLKCNSYNFTYCHRGFSFENALIDAEVTLSENPGSQILALGIDEITEHTRQVYQRINWNSQEPINPVDMIKEQKGTVYGEAANAFVLSDNPGNSCAGSIEKVELLYKPSQEEVIEKITNLTSEYSVDLALVGLSGDPQFDQFTPDVHQLAGIPTGVFKHLTGEYHTASAFATWLGAQILSQQTIPEVVLHQGESPEAINNILIYNHYNNLDHSFIILRK